MKKIGEKLARRNILPTPVSNANHSTQHNLPPKVHARHQHSALLPQFHSEMRFYRKLSSRGKARFPRAARQNLPCKREHSMCCSAFLKSRRWATSWGTRHLGFNFNQPIFCVQVFQQNKMCHFGQESFLDHHLIPTIYSFMYFLIHSFFRVLILETNGCRGFPVVLGGVCLQEISCFTDRSKTGSRPH